LQVCRQFVKIL